MSKIYNLLTNLTTNSIANTNNDKINVSKTSNIECEIQKVLMLITYIINYYLLNILLKNVFCCQLHDIQKRIAQLKIHII